MYILNWKFSNGEQGQKSFNENLLKSQQALWIRLNLKDQLFKNDGKVFWNFKKS